MRRAPSTAEAGGFPHEIISMINVIISPGLVVRDGKHLHSGRVLLVEGVVQREAEVINVIAQRVGPLGVG
jgi:hypothetical protein